MYRIMMSAIAGVLAIGTATAADPKLDGKWTVTSLERDGKVDESMKGATREQSKDKYSLTPKEGKAIEGTMTIDADKKIFDMKPSGGRYAGKTLLGIYKIEGDKLTICFAEPDKPRPTEFSSKGATLAVHERAK